MAYRLQSFSTEFGISQQAIILVNLETDSVCVFKQTIEQGLYSLTITNGRSTLYTQNFYHLRKLGK